MYFPDEADRQRLSPWERVLLDYAGEASAHCVGLLSRALEEVPGGGSSGTGLCRSPGKGPERLFPKWRSWPGPETGTAFPAGLRLCPRPGGAPCGGYDGDPLKDRLEAFRKEVKRVAEELGKYFSANREACWENRPTAPLVKSLQTLTLRFSQRYAEKKRRATSWITATWNIRPSACFWGEDGQPTAAAREVAARFDEIMIDEYQGYQRGAGFPVPGGVPEREKPVYGGGRKAEHLRLPPGHAGNFPPGQKGLSEV